MFTINPFSELSGFISPLAMQMYVIAMVLLVVGGTVLDMIHKKSAQYFFNNAEKAKAAATRTVSAGEKASIAFKTVAEDVLTSGEFCNPQRRVAHLLTMYGFILFAATTAIMIFGYADAATPAILPLLWHIGALMLCVGGYWFWFFIRVDVAAEGNPWYRVMRADLFVLSLLATATFASDLVRTAGGRCRGLVNPVLLVCSSSPAPCCSEVYCGPNLPICSLNPQRRFRSAWPRRTVPGMACRHLQTNPSSLVRVSNGCCPRTTDQHSINMVIESCNHWP